MKGTVRRGLITILCAIAGTVLTGCTGGGDKGAQSNSGGSIDVAIVDTPNTQDLARLTPSLFTAQSHIEVNYTILDEGTLREVITSDVPAGGRQFDVVMIGPYEAPQFGKDGYITDLTPMASSDRAYELDDIIPSVRNALSYEGRLYAAPFYGESSFLMYRKDVLRTPASRCPHIPRGRRSPTSRGRIDTSDQGRHLPARQAGLGRARRSLHHRAEHVRGNVVVRQAGRLGRTRRWSTSRRSAKRSSSTSTSSETRASPAPPPRTTTSASRST